MAALLLLPLLLLLSSSTPLQAQQNITLGSSLTPQGPNSFWLSPSGGFAFGFRPVIDGNTSSYLLAVWFNKTTDKTVAWYANTADPDAEVVQVSPGARLQLNSKGALSLQDSTGTEVWKPNAVGAAYAAMLDTGNFVMVAADGSTLWGTFDTPTDTILLTQEITPGMTLRSRIMPTDYSNGRFLLDMDSEYVALYLVAVPSGYKEGYYWYIVGNITKLVFDAAGTIYTAMGNGTNITMTSGVPGSMAEYYHRATLDTDGVFRQYVYLKDSGQWSPPAWATVGFQPPDICQPMLSLGSGTCGFNSYCKFDGATNQTSCFCPPQYSFIDEDRKYKGCKPDFQPQSCDMDEASAMMQFDLTWENHVDWPLADYETYQHITENQCQTLCLTDCFCAATVYQEATSTCWKKKFPLSNGRMKYDVDRKFLLKLPKSNSSQIELQKNNSFSQTELNISSKWKKDKTTYCTVTRIEVQPLQSSFNNLGLPLKAFTYAEFEEATNGFKEVTGTGASGVVYKGQLQDEVRTCIAVKKLDKIQKETEKEFTVEVQAIGQTNHKNLVRLLGFCSEGNE
ncbi:hypothetical protein U9M48_031157 [Paspalum notatum var. saurae]|uniref:non-specific serine/threonine protein kinase n=1 Tax=Paspalum notatum var. saurae TaxID=547442 RepID=A0AAQ3X434_PASNO